MMNRFKQVGFSQRIQIDWMRYAADLVLAGSAPAEIEEALQDLLSNKLSVGGNAKRGNREKAITIISKIWVRPPPDVQALRDDGLELLREISKAEKLAVQWGLVMAVYPFWGVVAETIGRLLRLQGTAAVAQVQRRMKERMGQRETVARAAHRVLRSFHDWGILAEEGAKGIYVGKTLIQIHEPRLTAWLMEAYLLSRKEERATSKGIMSNPAFFPFVIDHCNASVAVGNPRLEVSYHGFDEELISLPSWRRLSSSPRRRAKQLRSTENA